MRITAALLLVAVPAAALAQATPSTATGTAAKTANRDDKVICKSFAEVGSLVASKKECKTRREWDAESSYNQKRLSDCTTGAGATGARC